LTRTSIRPNCRRACSTIASTDSREVTSVRMPTAPPPMPCAVSFAVLSLMSVTTTVAPSAASFSAIALPMPRPAPVTIAILLSSLGMSLPPYGASSRPSRCLAMINFMIWAVPSPICRPSTSRSRCSIGRSVR